MRTKELKLNNEIKEAVLVAGGPGFKIYTVLGFNGWVISLGKKNTLIDDSKLEAKTISQYVSLKFQPEETKETIKENFNKIIKNLKQEKA